MTVAQVNVRAFAKVNLFLRVGEARDDGFHDIETVLQAVELADEVGLARRERGISLDVRTHDGLAVAPGDRTNLAWRAAEALAEHLQKARRASDDGVGITLDKRIPAAAGLGGGSSDAAAVLRGLEVLWDVELSPGDLVGLAASLGSDVPYFACGNGTALAKGRGEIVVALPPRDLWFVLGCSAEPLSTAAVYRAWDALASSRAPSLVEFLETLGSGTVSELGGAIHNDLEPAALSLQPQLARALEDMTAAGAVRACVSGSGPTIFGLCESQRHALQVEQELTGRFDRLVVASTRPTSFSLHPS